MTPKKFQESFQKGLFMTALKFFAVLEIGLPNMRDSS